MTRDLVYSLVAGLVHGLVYVVLLIAGLWLAKPEIDALLEVLP